ncbi:MAG: hypothetical protein MI741_12260, partial [Rhodospirillales bacterium]|nr:hypothetical protein [Rhodospirillales bacterium]
MDNCDERFRHSEWVYLRHQADSSAWTWEGFDRLLACHLNEDGELKAVDRTGRLHIARLGSDPVEQRSLPTQGEVYDAAFSPDGNYIALQSLREWLVIDLRTDSVISRGENGAGGHRPIAFLKDGSGVILGSRASRPVPVEIIRFDGSMVAYPEWVEAGYIPLPTEHSNYLLQREPNRLISLDSARPPGQLFALQGVPQCLTAHNDEVYVGLRDGRIEKVLPNEQSGESARLLHPSRESVTALTTFEGWVFGGTAGGRVVARPFTEQQAVVEFNGLESQVLWVTVTQDLLLVASDAAQIKAWSLRNSIWSLSRSLEVDGDLGARMTVLNHGETVVIADARGRVRAARYGTTTPLWSEPVDVHPIVPLRVTPDLTGKRVLVSGGNGWAVLDAESGKAIFDQKMEGHWDVIPLRSHSALVTSAKGHVSLFDLEQLSTLPSDVSIQQPIAWRRDTHNSSSIVVAVAGEDDTQLMIWRPSSQAKPSPLLKLDDEVLSLTMTNSEDLVIGTRTAVFAPCPRPGLIVVDEE